MISIHVHSEGVAEHFRAVDERIQNSVSRAVYRTGALMQTKVRGNASGRPGPNVQTGDYRRGITVLNGTDRGIPVSRVFSNSPQAARLEYGFIGTDSLGRKYNQPPLPHWAPAKRDVEDFFYQEIVEAVKGSLG